MLVRRPRYLVIVKRGETRLFEELQSSLDRWPEGTEIVWDRRQGGERRAATQLVDLDRRQRQRRSQPDAMWYTHGFIVVETSQPPESSSRVISAT
jgi:hypothetical protein